MNSLLWWEYRMDDDSDEESEIASGHSIWHFVVRFHIYVPLTSYNMYELFQDDISPTTPKKSEQECQDTP